MNAAKAGIKLVSIPTRTTPTKMPAYRSVSKSEIIRNRRNEYMTNRDFKIYIATWNVDSLNPTGVALSEWLHTTEDSPDIYAVGFQEINMDGITVLMGDTKVNAEWVKQILDGLHTGAEYEELKTVRFVGMQLSVIVKKQLKSDFTEVMTDMVATGALNVYGNKGGIGISFCFHNSLFCFINSHFAAHQNEYEKRNENFQEIMSRMLFKDDDYKSRRIKMHDHIFWLGDLNYRIDDRDMRIGTKKFLDYAKLDQLNMAKLAKKAFVGFNEGNIDFPPTYKYDKGANTFDSSPKCRIPAWTDRILWKSDTAHQSVYNSVMTMKLSDHRAVYGYFVVNLEVQDNEKLQEIVREVLSDVDPTEDALFSRLNISSPYINFGPVKVNDKITKTISLSNEGVLPVCFKLKNKYNMDFVNCPWLEVSQTDACFLPNTKIYLAFTCKVTTALAYEIYAKAKKSNKIHTITIDILILHVENGNDIFLTLTVDFRPSCFGMSFDYLEKLSTPINHCRLDDFLMSVENDSVVLRRNKNPTISCFTSIPKEIWLLVNYLDSNINEFKSLFNTDKHGRHAQEVNMVRDWLDNWGINKFPGTVNSGFDALLMIFETSHVPLLELSDSEILFALVHKDQFKCCQKLLIEKVSPLHRRIFIYICLFFQQLVKRPALIHLTHTNLAAVLAEILIRENKTKPGNVQEPPLKLICSSSQLENKKKFIMQFLSNDFPTDWLKNEFGKFT